MDEVQYSEANSRQDKMPLVIDKATQGLSSLPVLEGLHSP